MPDIKDAPDADTYGGRKGNTFETDCSMKYDEEIEENIAGANDRHCF
jgi:hypothetical protein